MKRKYKKTTDSDHPYRYYPNLIKNYKVTSLNQVWVADITYIRILTGFVYLAVILDSLSRKTIGYALGKKLNGALTIAALKMALSKRKPKPGIIHHSDRGVQYAANEYIELLKKYEFEISMSNKGNPYENGKAESFFKTLKYEEVHLYEYKTVHDVLRRIPFFIKEVYNKKRLHSSLGYMPPDEFEEKLMLQEARSSNKFVTFASR
jgi:transposase InsO family protein